MYLYQCVITINPTVVKFTGGKKFFAAMPVADRPLVLPQIGLSVVITDMKLLIKLANVMSLRVVD